MPSGSRAGHSGDLHPIRLGVRQAGQELAWCLTSGKTISRPSTRRQRRTESRTL